MQLDYASELARERVLLVKAERDLTAGEARVLQHLATMRAHELWGNEQAERLLRLLQDTLAEWTRHCDMIRERVTYLEARVLHPRTPGWWQPSPQAPGEPAP